MESKSNEKKWGRKDTWKLIHCDSHLETPGFLESTFAMQIEGVNNDTTFASPGVLLKVRFVAVNPDGGSSVSESVTHIPCCRIMEEYDNDGKVVSRYLQTSYE